jgi:hypothetical protein
MRLVSSKYGTAIAVCVMAMALSRIAAAQDAQEARPAEQKGPPAPAVPPAPGSESRSRAPVPAIPALKNIQVEITIIDQVGTETPLKKTLTVIAADHGSGSVRSKATVAVPMNPLDKNSVMYQELPLNVDIRPDVTENKTRIRTRLILNYETLYVVKNSNAPPVKSIVFVDQTVMLDNGKPIMVSQSADATNDRKVAVELKATILP